MKIVMINDRHIKLKVKLLFKKTYYMAQVTSGKIARCDWLVRSRALLKLLMPCEQKQIQHPTK